MLDRDVQIEAERRREQRRRAEHRLRIRQALQTQRQQGRRFAGVSLWLGKRFVRWGVQLQQRYSTADSIRVEAARR